MRKYKKVNGLKKHNKKQTKTTALKLIFIYLNAFK